MRTLFARTFLCIALTIFATGCAVNPTGGINTPGNVNDSPQYRIQKYLLIVADANKATVQLVIQLNTSKILPDTITRDILQYNRAVAQAAKTATEIMRTDGSNAEKAASIQALLKTLPLPENIKSFVGSTHPEAVGAVVAGLLAVQNTIMLLMTSAGSLQ